MLDSRASAIRVLSTGTQNIRGGICFKIEVENNNPRSSSHLRAIVTNNPDGARPACNPSAFQALVQAVCAAWQRAQGYDVSTVPVSHDP